MINKNKKIKAKPSKTTTNKSRKAVKTTTKKPAKVVKKTATKPVKAVKTNAKNVEVNPFSNANCVKKNKTSFKVQRIQADTNGLKIVTKNVKLTPKTSRQFKEYIATNNLRRI